MRTDDRSRNEPNKAFVFTLPVPKRCRGTAGLGSTVSFEKLFRGGIHEHDEESRALKRLPTSPTGIFVQRLVAKQKSRTK